MKRLLSTAAALLLMLAATTAAANDLPKMFAHRGGHTHEIPENTPAAVASAKRFGYAGVELDVRLTKDGKMVVFHDKTINRKMRNATDYSRIEEKISVRDLTFDELRNNYVLASPNPAMRFPVATLDEILLECKRQGMIPMLHSKYVASYRRAQELFGDEWICFTSNVAALEECRTFSKCLILYGIRPNTVNGADAVLERLGGRCGVSTMQSEILTEERIAAWRKKGYEVQASVFKAPLEVEATRRGVSMHLTDFALVPDSRFKRVDGCSEERRTLALGEELSYKWNKTEYGGVALSLQFRGEVEIVVHGKRTYQLTSDGRKPIVLGVRLAKGTPSLTVRALRTTKLRSLACDVYEF